MADLKAIATSDRRRLQVYVSRVPHGYAASVLYSSGRTGKWADNTLEISYDLHTEFAESLDDATEKLAGWLLNQYPDEQFTLSKAE